jgi:nucleoside-diphosphate-sugar epimerase
MRIAVTGGTGFVGSCLLEALLSRGDRVVCLVRDPARLERLFPGGGPEWVRGNLGDRRALDELTRDCEAVVHVAGLTHARRREEFYAVNAEGTATLLAAAAEAGAGRFVHVSSLAASGPSAPGRPAVESDPPRPVSTYGASKLAGEQLVRDSELPWIVLRPPAVYGPRDREFLALFRSVRFGVAPLFGDGSQLLSMIAVEDLAGAILAALDRAPPGSVYFTAHPEIVTARQVAVEAGRALDLAGVRRRRRSPLLLRVPRVATAPLLGLAGRVATLLGKSTVLSADKAAEFLAPAFTCDSGAIERATGWRAGRDLASGLAETARWYVAAGWIRP